MTIFSPSERLITWLDVERVLKQHTELWTTLPTSINSIDCYADGMEITFTGPQDLVNNWLRGIFGRALAQEQKSIHLRIPNTSYPISFSPSHAPKIKKTLPIYPLWREVTYLKESSRDEDQTHLLPVQWSSGPQIVSFHSFKGGVGRTTALMTYVTACVQLAGITSKKILIVDADIEAPGVSFWLEETNRPTVSFIQLLESLHYPPKSVDDSLDFFAEELKKTSLNVDGSQRELFILPAALELSDIQDMPVHPGHLARNPENPWILTDHLHALGERLGADTVFIDLRAGLSELASPILFDPRVDHFFVTTVATQSIAGMAEILKRLNAFNSRLPQQWKDIAKPTVILSLLTKELRDTIDYQRAIQTLSEAYPADPEIPLSAGIEWLEAEFLSTLMSISSLRQALESLKQSTVLFSSATSWAEENNSDISGDFGLAAPQKKENPKGSEKAKNLFDICKRAQFAENDEISTMLATEPLRNLGKHYSKELPNIVIVGAKGAGKTFTFRQMVNSKEWPIFLEKNDLALPNENNAGIFPALWSSNINDRPDGDIKSAQYNCLARVDQTRANLLVASAIEREISTALSSTNLHWDLFWENLICRQFGMVDGNIKDLNNLLFEKDSSIIFIFDGIEDAFEDPTSSASRDAIQSLLKFPNRLSELENRRIGSIVFARIDYVSAAIRQNQGQFLSRYLPFQLQWNPESFLRLAYWLCCQAGIFSDNLRQVEKLRLEELKEKLETLWGKKLGTEKSKEAHSARWVFAALCDLKGNVQARDLVRFLKFSSELEEIRPESLSDRILAPESMRKAIPLCSQEKVEELEKEVAPLREWLKLLGSDVPNKKIPFSATSMKLTPELLKTLQEIGIIYEDVDGALGDERLFLPEIYRSGLGFETSVTGRPRMQALLKKTLGRMPL